MTELRKNREATGKQADSLRDSLAGVRARHSTLTQILNDHSYTGEAVQKLFAANERTAAGISEPSACWRITPRCRNNTNPPRAVHAR